MLTDADIEAIARELMIADGRDPDQTTSDSEFGEVPTVPAWHERARFVKNIAATIEAIERRKQAAAALTP